MKTCFGRRASSSRSRNSVAVSAISSPFRRTSCAAGSISRSPTAIDLGPARLGRAPQHGADPRDELGQLERLRHVVVRAELEPDDDVDGVRARREEDDRHLALAPDRAADLEPVELGEHDVEDDEVEGALAEAGEPLAAVRRCRDLESGLGEPERRDLPDRRVVLDEQHALVHGKSLVAGGDG